ncbi:DMT family transporter [Ancylobacter vacuolatus]|uniref:S-adenosylmethionine uptake transporter n=1 Tax=Ancylobacter vacuolatus TaxID=223389 RepID=A0ABU0DMX4_9HYPH|nr:DMT family transporter [Ancylobacter vacuolatus]MDQ0349785.1 S-adenosylmethionine uptake transporter [Ancylobacter vacuolatus]
MFPAFMRGRRLAGPALVTITAIGFLSIMDGMIKYATAEYSAGQIAVLRYAFGSLAAGAVFLATRTPLPAATTWRPHLWRSVLVSITAVTFFYSLSVLQLAVALALSFTSPLFIALFAALFLGERPGKSILLALGLGFAGVLVVLWNELDVSAGGSLASGPGIAAALVAAVTYALAMVTLKSRAARDPAPTIVLLQNVFSCMLVSPLAVLHWTPPTGAALLLFVGIGLLGTAGHLCMAWAYARADASRLGVFEYTAFVWALAIGLLAFNEIPAPSTLAGAALIAGGALLASRRSKVREAEVEIGP